MWSIVRNRINPDETVIVRSHQDVIDWCNKHNITVAEFNQPVIIPKDVTDCSRMFEDCESFNQSVVIPEGVTDCDSMFFGCIRFNQSVEIPNTVKYYSMMFYGCDSMVSDIIVADESFRSKSLCYNIDLIKVKESTVSAFGATSLF